MEKNNNIKNNGNKNNKSLRILQWNCCSFIQKRGLLQNIAQKYDVIILLETWLKPLKNTLLENFIFIRNDRLEDKGGGIAIAIKKHIKFDILKEVVSVPKILETLAIEILTESGRMALVAIYRSPNNLCKPKNWLDLLHSLRNHSFAFIGGDFNLHHYAWGSDHASSQAERLLDIFEDYTLLNNGSPTYLDRRTNKSSCIDLSFISPQLFPLTTWEVLDENLLSDHYLIDIEIKITLDTIPHRSHRFNSSQVNDNEWSNFRLALESFDINLIPQNLSTKEKYDELVKLIINQFEINCPSGQKNSNNTTVNNNNKKHKSKGQPPWWTKKCQEVDEDRKKALKAFRENPSLINNLEEKEKIAKKTFKTEKAKSFRKYCEKLSPLTPISEIFNQIKKFSSKQLDPLATSTNIKNIEAMENFALSLCPPSGYFPSFPTIPEPSDESKALFELDFSLEELQEAIDMCLKKIDSSPGTDKIDNRIISNLPKNIVKYLLEVYNSLFKEGAFPDNWKEFLILLIPTGTPKKFRPISLAQNLLKIMERMVVKRVTWWVENKNYLPKSQYGFRKGKSCLDNLTILTSSIYKALDRKDFLIAIFLDIKGAFNNVNPNILINCLKDLDLTSNICKFFYNLTSERNILFKINGEQKGPFKAYNGVPQGSVSSPLLYNIYTKLVESVLDGLGVSCLCFADDIVIYCTRNNINECLNIIQEGLNRINNYINNLGMSISPEKTNMVIFTRNKINIDNFKVILDSKEIRACKQAKFLGLILDSKLSWNPQLAYMTKKFTQRFNILKSLSNTWWGGHPQTLLLIYKAILRSTLDYGLICIKTSTKYIKKLGVLQRRALRSCMGLRQSTPNKIVLSESKDQPIEIRSTYLAYKYILRALSNQGHPLIETIYNLLLIFS